MEFNECLFGRRSVRNYTDESVDVGVIKDIIWAAIHAPSACNFAAWKFIVITTSTPKREALKNDIALRAPYGILVVYRNDIYVSGRKFKDYVQSAAAAVQNMLLYITSVGLGAVWICNLPSSRALRKAFAIPDNFDVIGYVAFGHPHKGLENTTQQMVYHYGNEVSFREHRRRYTLEQVMCQDSFQAVDGDCTKVDYPKRRSLARRIINKAKRILLNPFKQSS